MNGPGGLLAFQRRMAAAVMTPLTSKETMVRRRPDGVRMENEAAGWVKPNDQLSSFERLEIYNRQYWFRILASLREDFPGLRAVLGRTRFETMIKAYLAECPSQSFTLRDLGLRLPGWLQLNPRWLAARADLAMDMARLEWAHIEAFDLAAEPAMSFGALTTVDEATRLILQPHLRLLQLGHPVDDLLLQVRDQPAESDTPGNGAVVVRRGRSVHRTAPCAPEEIFLAVHRHAHTVYYKRLKPEEYRILRAIRSGAALGAAIEAGFDGSVLPDPERTGFLQQAFQQWASFGWFSQAQAPLDPQGDAHVDRDE